MAESPASPKAFPLRCERLEDRSVLSPCLGGLFLSNEAVPGNFADLLPCDDLDAALAADGGEGEWLTLDPPDAWAGWTEEAPTDDGEWVDAWYSDEEDSIDDSAWLADEEYWTDEWYTEDDWSGDETWPTEEEYSDEWVPEDGGWDDTWYAEDEWYSDTPLPEDVPPDDELWLRDWIDWDLGMRDPDEWSGDDLLYYAMSFTGGIPVTGAPATPTTPAAPELATTAPAESSAEAVFAFPPEVSSDEPGGRGPEVAAPPAESDADPRLPAPGGEQQTAGESAGLTFTPTESPDDHLAEHESLAPTDDLPVA